VPQCNVPPLLLFEDLRAWKPFNLSVFVEPDLSSRCHAHLKPFDGTDSYVEVNNRFLTSSPFFILKLVRSFCPHLGYPLRFLELSLSIAHNIDLRIFNTGSPSPDDFCFLYAPSLFDFYDSDPSVLHHSSASSPHIYYYKDLHNYSAKLLAQRSSSTIS
jgi:hypothetical protein